MTLDPEAREAMAANLALAKKALERCRMLAMDEDVPDEHANTLRELQEQASRLHEQYELPTKEGAKA